MPEDKSHDSGFRVVDRRPFTVDGTRREEAPQEAEKPEARKVAATPSRVVVDREPEDYLEPEDSGFEALVLSLSTTAMFQLGLMTAAGGERIPPDLANARRTIDLLGVLKEKTQGNLTAEESRFLDEVLYELRLNYVEVEKRGTPKKR